MEIPLLLTNSLYTGGKSYIADYQDFFYYLVVYPQTGFEIGISKGRSNMTLGGQFSKGDLLGKLDYCLKWLNHLQSKVINQEQAFEFYQVSERGTYSYCAISNELKTAFVSTSERPGPAEIRKSLKVHTNTDSYSFTSQRRESRKIVEIKRRECMEGWQAVKGLITCFRQDLVKEDLFTGDQKFTAKDKNEILKACKQHKIPFEVYSQNQKQGIRINRNFFQNPKAAQLYLHSLIEEKRSSLEPSYNIHLDKPG